LVAALTEALGRHAIVKSLTVRILTLEFDRVVVEGFFQLAWRQNLVAVVIEDRIRSEGFAGGV
jgi:hypothetical protein